MSPPIDYPSIESNAGPQLARWRYQIAPDFAGESCPQDLKGLFDYDRNPRLDHLRDFCDVPVGEADAPVARVAPDEIRVARAMNPNSLLVELDPYHTRRVVRTGRQDVEG